MEELAESTGRKVRLCDIEDNLQNLKALIDMVSNCDTDVADRLSVQITLGLAKKELLEIAEKTEKALILCRKCPIMGLRYKSR